MPHKRYLQRLLMISLIMIGIGWQFAPSPDASQSHLLSAITLQVDTPYIVPVNADQVMLRLPFDANTEYDLIISSLSSTTKTYEISLSTEAESKVTSVQQSSFQKLQPLSQKPKMIRTTTPPTRQFVTHRSAPQERTFRLHVTDGSLDDPAQYIAVPSRLIGEGTEVRIYLDRQIEQQELASGLVDEIIRLFDKKIVPGFAKQIGRVRDVDQDGKLTLLLTPWLGQLQGGKTSLDGFVRGSDFDPNVELPYGHRCDMMYLNSRLKPGKHLQSLIAHELTHALLFSSRLKNEAGKLELHYEADWLNEAIAHVGENLQGDGWSNLDYRISRFLESPRSYPLVVEDYYHSGLWRNHGCRGATYLFLRWVVDTYGVEVLPKLIQSQVNGIQNIEQVTGRTFPELFRRWNVSLLMSQQQKQTVDLWGHLGRWNLAGVAMQQWDMTSQTKNKLALKGTTSAFVHLKGTSNPSVQQITIQSTPQTKLQVTLVKRFVKTDRIQISSTLASISNKLPNKLKSHQLQTEIQYDVTRYQVETISVEANSGNVKESISFHKKMVQAAEDKLTTDETCHRFTFTLPGRFRKLRIPLLIKVVMVDQQGNRTAVRQRLHQE